MKPKAVTRRHKIRQTSRFDRAYNLPVRRLSIAAFVLLLASIPVFAQHGGGHASAGSHGGMASHSSFGGHAMATVRSAPSASSRPALRAPNFRSPTSFGPATRGPAFRQPLSPGFNHFRGPIRGPRIQNFRNCFGCRRPFGLYAGYYDPWWWWDSDSSYDQDAAQQMEMANEMNQQSLEEQQMRQQNEADSYGPSAYSGRRSQPQNYSISAEPAAPATVLVFRDQHRQEVQNYAIVGQTLWSFAPQRTQKIPLADLDIQATEKANDDRGVEFKVPADGQGQ
jgi:hypothetical protein